MATLTEEQRQTANDLAARADQHGLTAVDLSDDRQYEYFRDMFVAGGTTPEKYPGFHGALEATRQLHQENGGPPALPQDGPWLTTGLINTLGTTSDGNASASGLVSVVNGGAGVYADLLVTDPGGHQLAHQSDQAWVDGEFLEIATPEAGAAAAVPGMTATLNAAVKQGGNLIPIHAIRTQTTAANDPVVTAPVIKQGAHRNYIFIGLGRNATDPTVDYGFAQADPDNGLYMLPLVSSIDFGQPIDFSSLAFVAALTRAMGQGGGTVYLPVDQVQKLLNNTVPDTDSQVSTYCPPTDPLSFVQIHWSADQTTYLTATYSAKAQSTGQLLTASIASTDTGVDNQVDGTALIPSIVFTWHCLDAATPVLRSDGSETEISQLQAGDEVQGPGGVARRVHSTWAAPHRGAVLRLRTTSGRTLVLSLQHLLMTPDGPIPVDELRAGMAVNTVEGSETVESLETVDGYNGVLWNLSLGPIAQDAEPAENSFFAAGLESADHEAQTEHRRRQLADPEWVRAALPEDLRPDYESWLEKRAAAAA